MWTEPEVCLLYLFLLNTFSIVYLEATVLTGIRQKMNLNKSKQKVTKNIPRTAEPNLNDQGMLILLGESIRKRSIAPSIKTRIFSCVLQSFFKLACNVMSFVVAFPYMHVILCSSLSLLPSEPGSSQAHTVSLLCGALSFCSLHWLCVPLFSLKLCPFLFSDGSSSGVIASVCSQHKHMKIHIHSRLKLNLGSTYEKNVVFSSLSWIY